MTTKTVFEVKSMDMRVQESAPPHVRVKASGTTRTGGWTNPRLAPIIHKMARQDGMLELSFVADEPTGDLDARSAEDILDLMQALNQDFGKTIVMVTHDPRAASRAHSQEHLEKGVLLKGDR